MKQCKNRNFDFFVCLLQEPSFQDHFPFTYQSYNSFRKNFTAVSVIRFQCIYFPQFISVKKHYPLPPSLYHFDVDRAISR